MTDELASVEMMWCLPHDSKKAEGDSVCQYWQLHVLMRRAMGDKDVRMKANCQIAWARVGVLQFPEQEDTTDE